MLSRSESQQLAPASSLIAEMQRLADTPSIDGPSATDGTDFSGLDWLRFLPRGESFPEASGRRAGDVSPPVTKSGATTPFPLRVGRFELHSVLGSGGFGIVFQAFDPKLDRHVALKILRPEAALSPQMSRRFLREAKSAAQLEHPGIVSVYEVGRYAGLNFLAAPLCEGPDLGTWLKQHPQELSPRQSALVVAKVAEAVHHAHQRGILHRDLKPSNILLKPIAATPRPKPLSHWERVAAQPPGEGGSDSFPFEPLLADFGLAGRVDRDADETCYGTVLGTIHYMSPEQAAGRWQDVGVPSDVYSLGVILYELLSGVRPFTGSAEEIQHAIGSRAPISPRQLFKAVPLDLETVCLKCLAKEPSERYATAGDLAADLHRILRHEPIHARQASIFKQSWMWCRRRPVIAVLLLLLALTLVTSAVVTGALYRQERAQRARSEEHLDFAREAVSKMYTKVADQWLVEQPEVQDLRREFLEDALKFHERIAAQQPRDERSRHDLSVALHRMANISFNLGHRVEGVQFRQECLEIVDSLRRDFPENTTYQYDAFMNRMLLAGEDLRHVIDSKLSLRHEAEEILRRLVNSSPENPVYRDALAALCVVFGRHYVNSGQPQQGERFLHEAADISEALAQQFPDRPVYKKHAAMANAQLALRRLREGKDEQAAQNFSKAQRLIDEVRHQVPEARWTDNWSYEVQIAYAFALADTADMKTAVPLLEDCRESLSRLIAWYPKTPGYRETRSEVCGRLADAYAQLDQTAEMLAALEMAHSDARTIPDESTATSLLQQIDQLKKHLPTTSPDPPP